MKLEKQLIDDYRLEIQRSFWNKLPEIKDLDTSAITTKAFLKIQTALQTKISVDEVLIESAYERFRKNKNRWYKSQFLKDSAFEKDISSAEFVLNGPNGEVEFLRRYKVKTITEYRKNQLTEMDDWRLDKNRNICEFAYYPYMDLDKIETAAINDIFYLVMCMLKDASNGDSEVYGLPNILVGNTPAIPGKSKIDFNDSIMATSEDGIKKKYGRLVYKIDDNKYFETRYDIQKLKETSILLKISPHQTEDYDVLNRILSFAEPDFFTTRQIKFIDVDLMKRMGWTRSQRNYQKLKECIERLYFLEISIYNGNGDKGFNFRILDNRDELTIDGKKGTLVVINIEIVNQIISHQTVKIYKNKLEALTKDSSKILIYRLEKERWSNHLEGNRSSKMTVDIYFFRSVFLFAGKRKTRHFHIIEEALDDIVANDITLKSYVRTGDYFELEFYPISEGENIDLTIDNDYIDIRKQLVEPIKRSSK